MDKKSRLIYNLINLLVLGLAAGLFFFSFFNRGVFGSAADPKTVAVVVLTVVVVHFVKALRLYLAVFGSNMDFGRCLRFYCKVTPVSVLIPWKLGEIYRIYCMGWELKDALKGIVVIILDRSFDTAALLVMITLLWMAGGGAISPLVYGLLIFLAFVILLYYAYPATSAVWKKKLLSSKATASRLNMLGFLDMVGRMYEEIKAVVSGRGMLLFVLSLMAWGAEIGSLALLAGGDAAPGERVQEYLFAAIGMGESPEMTRFVMTTIVLLIIVYLTVKISETIYARSKR